MAALGVLAAVLPEGADPAALAGWSRRARPPDPLLRLAALLTGDPLAVALRLKLSAGRARSAGGAARRRRAAAGCR